MVTIHNVTQEKKKIRQIGVIGKGKKANARNT